MDQTKLFSVVLLLALAVLVSCVQDEKNKESDKSKSSQENQINHVLKFKAKGTGDVVGGGTGPKASTKVGSPIDKAKILKEDPYGKMVDQPFVDLGFIHAFVASLSVIIVSELGDKTFFIAAIMAMRHPRLTVYLGAIAALGLMTVMSAVLGYATTVIPRWFTYYASSALFAIFGLKMLREGYTMSPDEGAEEMEEAQADIRKKEEELERQGTSDVEMGTSSKSRRSLLNSFFSRIFLQAFTLTFLAEWGDRSQIATIILAARDEVIGVILGGTLGHALCTGLAVIGGRLIAQRISIRTVHLVGGVVFLIFALSAFVIEPDNDGF